MVKAKKGKTKKNRTEKTTMETEIEKTVKGGTDALTRRNEKDNYNNSESTENDHGKTKDENTNRKKIIFKQGVPELISSKEAYAKANAGINKQRFNINHYGDCIVSAKLKELNSTTRSQNSYLRIINIIMSKKHKPDKVVKIGFRTADIDYNSPIKANDLLSDTMISKSLEYSILNQNMFAWIVISDWDGDMMLLGEAIDRKEHIVSIERIKKAKDIMFI